MSEDRPNAERVLEDRRLRFEDMYRECNGAVAGYVLRRVDDREAAADVIAETFLIAWRRLDDVPSGEHRLWLYGVARRVLANHRRGERVRSSLAQRLRNDLISATYDDVPSGDLAELGAAYRRLPAADREVLALEGWENLDYGQIAVVLGCSRNAVRIRLHRARRRLARELADQTASLEAPVRNLGLRETT